MKEYGMMIWIFNATVNLTHVLVIFRNQSRTQHEIKSIPLFYQVKTPIF